MLTNQPLKSSVPLTPTDHGVAAAEPAVGSTQGCPTPLDWQQVVAAFREEREVRQVQTSLGGTNAVRFGSGPPLILLNGFLGSHELFAMLAWVLRNEHAMVMLDWPTGDARMQRVSAQKRLSQLAHHVTEVAEAFAYEQWAIHATSFGCLVALQSMLDFPDRITRASLQGAFARRRFSLAERALIGAARWSRRNLQEIRWARVIQQENNRRWFPPFDVTRWEFYAEQVGATPVRGVAKLASIAGGADLSDRLAEITSPLLLIACEGDGRLSLEAQHAVAESVPHSQLESLDHCGALPHLTHPHRLAKVLRQFRDDGPSCPDDSRKEGRP